MSHTRQLCLAACLVCLTLASARADENTPFSGTTMGTTYSVKVNAPEEAFDAAEVQAAIDQRLDEIDNLMSTYKDDSEVSRFNRAPPGEWFEVSDETAYVVLRALEISQQTDGAFDITVAPLVRLWKFGAQGEQPFELPEDAAIEEALARTGYQHLDIRPTPPALRKTLADLEIDLSGIAKGYAVDEVSRLLRKRKLYQHMVEIGGEVRLAGVRADGKPWAIGIETPQLDTRQLERVIAPGDTAIASSGDYRNFHEHDGVLYSHTIEPRTGRPIKHAAAAVTVLTGDCATADALATALLVMGPSRGIKWAEQNKLAVLMLSRDEPRHVETSQFTAMVEPATPEKSGGSFGLIMTISLVVFVIAIVAMSVGVIINKRCIKGSCGGMAGLKDAMGKPLCDSCTNPSPECKEGERS